MDAAYDNAKLEHTDMTLFAHILSKHAMVMVDAAKPGNTNSGRTFYIRLGERLAHVQDAWAKCFFYIDEDDETYQGVVYKVIVDFTDRLIEMLVDNKDISPEELATLIADLHTKALLTRDAEWYLKQTRELFTEYVKALMFMFRANNKHNYETAALRCLTIAYNLGMWLDMTMY